MHLYPWYGKRVLIVSALLIASIQRAPAQDENVGYGSECRTLTMHVRDTKGSPVSDALVIVDNIWTSPTNFNGVATIQCKPGLRLPFAVEVTARGFKSASSTVGNLGLSGDTNIYLEREDTDLPRSTTVSASELSSQVQKDSSVLQQEGMQALQRGDNADAEQLLRRALEMTPSSGSIYNNIGVSWLRRGNVEEAATWFEKAVKVSPYDPQLLGNLGMMRWVQHRAEESYQLLDRAVAGGFSTPSAHYILGVMSLGKGQTEEAVKELRKTDPAKYPMRDLYLSIALNTQGKSKAASKTYETYLANNRAPLYLAYVPRSIEGQ